MTHTLSIYKLEKGGQRKVATLSYTQGKLSCSGETVYKDIIFSGVDIFNTADVIHAMKTYALEARGTYIAATYEEK